MQTLQSYIDGRFTAAQSGEVFDNINPATGALISKVEVALETEINHAIVAAEKGFRLWSAMSGVERGRILNKTAHLLRARNRELAIMRDNRDAVAGGEDCDLAGSKHKKRVSAQ